MSYVWSGSLEKDERGCSGAKELRDIVNKIPGAHATLQHSCYQHHVGIKITVGTRRGKTKLVARLREAGIEKWIRNSIKRTKREVNRYEN